MSIRSVANIAAALAIIFQPMVREQINRSCVALNLSPYQESDGPNLQWDAVFGDVAPTGGSVIADGADVTTFNSDDVQPAVLQWGTYSEAFAVTGKSMAAARAAKSPDELVDLFSFDMGRAVARLTKSINRDFYLGNGGPNTIAGLIGAGALANTGTYAGLSRASYPQWRATVNAIGGAARDLSFDLMRTVMTSIYTDSGLTPDLILCSPTVHDRYGSLFGNQRRYVEEITVGGRRIVLDAGYKALEFDGVPVVKDVDCPSGKMIFANSQFYKMRQLADVPNAGNRSPGILQLSGTEEAQLGKKQVRLYARINPLAVTGDAFKVQLILYPQLQVERPNAFGVLDDLS